MNNQKAAIALLAPLLRSANESRPVLLLGAGASFRSGVPTAGEAVKQIARIVYSEQELRGERPPERVKPTEWEPWLHSFPWFVKGDDRFPENFPHVVEHLLTPAEFRKRVLLDLMRPTNEISSGYRVLAEFVMRGLVRTIMTTNFDTCLREALAEKQPHIKQINEVNRGPNDYAEFDIYNKCQIIWLHGKAEQYSDKNQIGEINALDDGLLVQIKPLLKASPIIVIGYRGSEPSIMEGLFGQIGQGRLDFPKGVFWCQRYGEPLHPNVETFARRIGSNFRRIDIQGFDELFQDLAIELEGEDSYAKTATPSANRQAFFDEKIVEGATLEDLDLDLTLITMRDYCEKLGRAIVTRDTLLPLMREQGLLITKGNTDEVTAGAVLLFGKNPQAYFPHAVVSLTEAGKKRQVHEGNLISQRRLLLERLEQEDVNPVIKAKKQRKHEERRAYPPRAIVELLVNMLVHRDYEIDQPAHIEVLPNREIVFINPGSLLPRVARHTQVDGDGRFTLSERTSELRNPALCDVFFGISAMEKEGTGLLDVRQLMLEGGGTAAFYNKTPEYAFAAHIVRPQSSAGSKSVAYPTVPIGVYILNAMPFSLVPDHISVVKLLRPLSACRQDVDFTELGTFIEREMEIWSFVPLPILTTLLGPIADAENSTVLTRKEVESNPDTKRVLSWLLRKHWEGYLKSFGESGLILEHGRKYRAYFEGKSKQARTIVWDSTQRRGIRREVVKDRSTAQKTWFENEGFGYEIVEIGGDWCIRIKPFYMFTGRDAKTPLPSFTRAAKATRRMKFDRNKSVESDLAFWSKFLGRGQETVNLGHLHVEDLILEASFLTIEVPEIGLLSDEDKDQNRMSA